MALWPGGHGVTPMCQIARRKFDQTIWILTEETQPVPLLARHNPHFDRLSLFVCLHKLGYINLLHQNCKLIRKEDSVRSHTAVSERNRRNNARIPQEDKLD